MQLCAKEGTTLSTTVHAPKRTVVTGTIQFLKSSLRSAGTNTPGKKSSTATTNSELNVVQWLGENCPEDVVPLVLAYAGPQTVAALSKTCSTWKKVVDQQTTRNVLSKELYKVRVCDTDCLRTMKWSPI